MIRHCNTALGVLMKGINIIIMCMDNTKKIIIITPICMNLYKFINISNIWINSMDLKRDKVLQNSLLNKCCYFMLINGYYTIPRICNLNCN